MSLELGYYAPASDPQPGPRATWYMALLTVTLTALLCTLGAGALARVAAGGGATETRSVRAFAPSRLPHIGGSSGLPPVMRGPGLTGPGLGPSRGGGSASGRLRLGESDVVEHGPYPLLVDESVMAPKAHGTTEAPVQEHLRWGCDRGLADAICSFNRRFAARAGYWARTDFEREAASEAEVTFYDSVSGQPLFVAPRGRSMADFLAESRVHGWPSFRDEEVVWDNVRVIPSGRRGQGEAVSVSGTHLGHNIPDRQGNRYCINLVSVAGRPA